MRGSVTEQTVALVTEKRENKLRIKFVQDSAVAKFKEARFCSLQISQ